MKLFADGPWWRVLRERVMPVLRTYPYVDVFEPHAGLYRRLR